MATHTHTHRHTTHTIMEEMRTIEGPSSPSSPAAADAAMRAVWQCATVRTQPLKLGLITASMPGASAPIVSPTAPVESPRMLLLLLLDTVGMSPSHIVCCDASTPVQ